MHPAKFVAASTMAEAVYTLVEMRAQPVKATPVQYVPVRFPWQYRKKKPKQRTPEEILERERLRMSKKTQATLNSLNLTPLRVFTDAEIKEKLYHFENNKYARPFP